MLHVLENVIRGGVLRAIKHYAEANDMLIRKKRHNIEP